MNCNTEYTSENSPQENAENFKQQELSDDRIEELEAAPSRQSSIIEATQKLEDISLNQTTDEKADDTGSQFYKEQSQIAETGEESHENRMSNSRQSKYEDILSTNSECGETDVQSADSECLQIEEDIQYHPDTGISESCCDKTFNEDISDEDCFNIVQDEVITSAPNIGSDRHWDHGREGIKTEIEPKCEILLSHDVAFSTDSHPETRKKEISAQSNGQNHDGEEELNHAIVLKKHAELKMQIEVVQQKLETLIKENKENSLRIVSLKGDFLAMSEKLQESDTKCADFEVLPRPDISTSKTCSIF